MKMFIILSELQAGEKTSIVRSGLLLDGLVTRALSAEQVAGLVVEYADMMPVTGVQKVSPSFLCK